MGTPPTLLMGYGYLWLTLSRARPLQGLLYRSSSSWDSTTSNVLISQLLTQLASRLLENGALPVGTCASAYQAVEIGAGQRRRWSSEAWNVTADLAESSGSRPAAGLWMKVCSVFTSLISSHLIWTELEYWTGSTCCPVQFSSVEMRWDEIPPERRRQCLPDGYRRSEPARRLWRTIGDVNVTQNPADDTIPQIPLVGWKECTLPLQLLFILFHGKNNFHCGCGRLYLEKSLTFGSMWS